ncbi:MAG: hypothetical protein LBF56_00310 [Holosporales bacterium]|nr:hypothetical protein [Holosporales bacterium]
MKEALFIGIAMTVMSTALSSELDCTKGCVEIPDAETAQIFQKRWLEAINGFGCAKVQKDDDKGIVQRIEIDLSPESRMKITTKAVAKLEKYLSKECQGISEADVEDICNQTKTACEEKIVEETITITSMVPDPMEFCSESNNIRSLSSDTHAAIGKIIMDIFNDMNEIKQPIVDGLQTRPVFELIESRRNKRTQAHMDSMSVRVIPTDILNISQAYLKNEDIRFINLDTILSWLQYSNTLSAERSNTYRQITDNAISEELDKIIQNSNYVSKVAIVRKYGDQQEDSRHVTFPLNDKIKTQYKNAIREWIKALLPTAVGREKLILLLICNEITASWIRESCLLQSQELASSTELDYKKDSLKSLLDSSIHPYHRIIFSITSESGLVTDYPELSIFPIPEAQEVSGLDIEQIDHEGKAGRTSFSPQQGEVISHEIGHVYSSILGWSEYDYRIDRFISIVPSYLNSKFLKDLFLTDHDQMKAKVIEIKNQLFNKLSEMQGKGQKDQFMTALLKFLSRQDIGDEKRFEISEQISTIAGHLYDLYYNGWNEGEEVRNITGIVQLGSTIYLTPCDASLSLERNTKPRWRHICSDRAAMMIIQKLNNSIYNSDTKQFLSQLWQDRMTCLNYNQPKAETARALYELTRLRPNISIAYERGIMENKIHGIGTHDSNQYMTFIQD